MKQMLLCTLTWLLFPLFAISQGHIVSPTDFEVVLGETWEGTLTYQDYQSNEEVSIAVKLAVDKIVDGEYRFNYIYPDEPKANEKVKVKIGKNHMTINKNTIISREKLEDGTLLFETKEIGKDNKKKATIYNKYRLATSQFSISKRVKYDGTDEIIMRNKYSFLR